MENISVTDIRQAGVLLPPRLFYLYFVVFSKYTQRERERERERERGIALFLLRAFYLKRHSLRGLSQQKVMDHFIKGDQRKLDQRGNEGGELE